jgi:hypothetical protein
VLSDLVFFASTGVLFTSATMFPMLPMLAVFAMFPVFFLFPKSIRNIIQSLALKKYNFSESPAYGPSDEQANLTNVSLH